MAKVKNATKNNGTKSAKVSPAQARLQASLKKFTPLASRFGTAYKSLNNAALELGSIYSDMTKTGLPATKITEILRRDYSRFTLNEKYAITTANLKGWQAAYDRFGKHNGIRSPDGKHYASPDDIMRLGLNPAELGELAEAVVRPVDTVTVKAISDIAKDVSAGKLDAKESRAKVTALIAAEPVAAKSEPAKSEPAKVDTLKAKRAELVAKEKALAKLTAEVNALRAEVATLEQATKGGKVKTSEPAKTAKTAKSAKSAKVRKAEKALGIALF